MCCAGQGMRTNTNDDPDRQITLNASTPQFMFSTVSKLDDASTNSKLINYILQKYSISVRVTVYNPYILDSLYSVNIIFIPPMSKVAELKKMWQQGVNKAQSPVPMKSKVFNNSPVPQKLSPKPEPQEKLIENQQEVKLNFNDAKRLFQDKIKIADQSKSQTPVLKNVLWKKPASNENMPRAIIPQLPIEQVPTQRLSVSEAKKLIEQRLQAAKQNERNVKPISTMGQKSQKSDPTEPRAIHPITPQPIHSAPVYHEPKETPPHIPQQTPASGQEKDKKQQGNQLISTSHAPENKKANFQAIREQMEKQSKQGAIHLLSNSQYNHSYVPAVEPYHSHQKKSTEHVQIHYAEVEQTPIDFHATKANLEHVLSHKKSKEINLAEQTVINPAPIQQQEHHQQPTKEEEAAEKITKTIKQFDDSD